MFQVRCEIRVVVLDTAVDDCDGDVRISASQLPSFVSLDRRNVPASSTFGEIELWIARACFRNWTRLKGWDVCPFIASVRTGVK